MFPQVTEALGEPDSACRKLPARNRHLVLQGLHAQIMACSKVPHTNYT
jgi:hypothetical protein